MEAHRRSVALRPSPGGLVHFGNALRSAGDREGAAAAFREAIALDRAFAAAHYNLHAAIYEEAAPASPALDALGRALDLSPDHVFARFGRGVIDGWHGLEGPPLPADMPPFLAESLGRSASGALHHRGLLPAVPHHVVLHVGWFADTLPSFAAALDAPIALLHVDCDLYQSTRTALDALTPHLSPGAVIVFDDYLCNPGWREEEHRAFVEVATASHRRHRYAAFSPFSRQAVVVLEP